MKAYGFLPFYYISFSIAALKTVMATFKSEDYRSPPCVKGGRGDCGPSRQTVKGKEGTRQHVMLRSQSHRSLSGISRVLATCLGSWAGQRLKREKEEGNKQEQDPVPGLASLTY